MVSFLFIFCIGKRRAWAVLCFRQLLSPMFYVASAVGPVHPCDNTFSGVSNSTGMKSKATAALRRAAALSEGDVEACCLAPFVRLSSVAVAGAVCRRPVTPVTLFRSPSSAVCPLPSMLTASENTGAVFTTITSPAPVLP
ncbi:hypothetical protein TraAM80_07658 [Trypanosoma rangeli]|uniref:Secreted protein n=1 Tax=Trypanosoma rangeli TaxID=5698 RepID=A0A422N4B5_TRYRA|nr:uncharacterized protein TraAM80_07658 [Trypanosoma rangeli]RNF00333.1 hypothetical protein TraAM80_07658 [Trypanosoma rangeli]|eukprot:RNF00333.1 hypothetical protein TraAM80_07658 [Trypanosoma rangeli]